MLTSTLKKCVIPTRIRQFSTLVSCTRNCVQMKMQHCRREMVQSYFGGQNLALCRSYTTESDGESQITLPPLMDVPVRATPRYLYLVAYPLITAYKINLQVDQQFNITEFIEAARHAIIVISNALKNRDYESLNNFVADRTIRILKEKVDGLTPQQRDLIAVNKDDIIACGPLDINVQSSTNEDPPVSVVEIAILCYYKRGFNPEDVSSLLQNEIRTVCNYKFECTYRKNVGGPWIATIVNHFTNDFRTFA